MSRLRRLVVSDRFFFITCRLLPHGGRLNQSEFECLARVVRERREKHHFLLTAWVLLPDHWHGVSFPRFPATISTVMESVKVASTLRIDTGREQSGLLWQPRFFDRALRTVEEYYEKKNRRVSEERDSALKESLELRTNANAASVYEGQPPRW